MRIINIHVPGYPTHADAAKISTAPYLMAVLTSGHPSRDEDFAVYVAIVPLADPTDGPERDRMADWVCGSGAKQNLAQARRHFPHLTEEKYRL